MSKGEEKIEKLLRSSQFKFKREISFKGLKGKKNVPLRFDFAIYNSDWKLIALLEIDGAQHFQWPNKFHKTKSQFLQSKERDRQKNKFCLLNQIPLIRIPYWELENITLDKIFSTSQYRVQSIYHNDMIRR